MSELHIRIKLALRVGKFTLISIYKQLAPNSLGGRGYTLNDILFMANNRLKNVKTHTLKYAAHIRSRVAI